MIQSARRLLRLLLPLLLFAPALAHGEPAPLRVFLRCGPKTHGPGQHDHPRFLADWSVRLAERGAAVEGALRFPPAEALERADVLVMYAAEAATLRGEERARFDAFLERGGGLVVVHDGVCGEEPGYFAERAGGAWEHGVARYLEGEVGLYMTREDHPITRGIPHFDLQDEIYYELGMSPRARVLANAFHDVFSITPQMWVVDDGPYRAFVTLQGHEWATFSHPAFRAILLRGIAWAGRREADLFLTADELSALRYPPGGPLAPEVASEAHVLHEDFELSLVASEPLVVNPISLDWDAEGRLWVACTPGYPYKQESSGIPAHDEILVLEDTDGDGRMDASRVFADGLDLVTSFVFHGDGVIASAAPDLLWLRDTDGDGVCDLREVLYTGFGYGDTHATISNLRWGLDGWIHGTQGYSGGASRDIRSPYRDRVEGRESRSYGHVPNGLFRFLPDGSAIETVSAYGSNTWGLDFRPDGELFFTMANGSHLRHVLAPERVLAPARQDGARSWRDIVDHREVHRISEATRAPYVQIDFVGGFTAAAGSTIYSAGAWPEEYQGNHFVCEPTVNLVHRDVLVEDGPSFRASRPREAEFLASTDPWFRPVHTRTGPDGALYVLDFYNQAAVHNDTRGPKHGPTNAAVRPDRDRHHGRIWRVAHREPRQVDPEDDFQTALRRDRRWLEAGDPRCATVDTTSPARHVRTLWRAAQHLGQDPRVAAAALRALGSDDAGVRRAGALVAAGLPGVEDEELDDALFEAAADPSPRVRLAALEALASRPAGARPDPRLLAVWGLHGDAVARSAHLGLVSRDPLGHLEVALAADAPAGLVEASLALGAGGADGARAAGLVAALASAPPPDLAGSLRALQAGLPAPLRLGPEAAPALRSLLERTLAQPAAARELLPLAARLSDEALLGDALATLTARSLELVEDPDAELAARLDALAALLAVPGSRERAAAAAGRFLDPFFDLATQERVIGDLAGAAGPATDRALVEAFPRLSNASRDAIFAALVTRSEGASALLDAVEAEDIQATELGPGRVHRLRRHPDAGLAARADALLAARLGAETAAVEGWIEEHLAELLAPGDAARGAEVFRANCAVCHSTDLLDGDEGHVGPALDGMGAHGREHLLPFILRPNLSVEAAYLEYVAETEDGAFASGVLVSDAPDAITLAGSGGEVRVPRAELASLRSTGRSPMPTGFESLGAEALRDLLTFLCQGYEDHRILPLAELMSSTTEALYDARRDAKPMRFRRLGVVEVAGVPFELVDPARSASGNNALVLKGGAAADWDSKLHMPQRVEVPVGAAVLRVHVLGGIAAWGHPFFGEGEDLVRWTWVYADGVREEVLLRDGHEFADWIGRHDVPGSEFVEDLLAPGSWGQVRRFHVDPARPDVAVERIVLESFDNRMAPTFLALTAQVGGELETAAAPAAPEPARVLVVGGGSSHDYPRWFDAALGETLAASADLGPEDLAYTDRAWEIAPRLEGLEVLVLAGNQPLPDPELRAAILAHVQRGGGLLVLHAASWFNWADWPEYNRELVGGGARSHEAYGEFEVRLTAPDHPVVAGLPEGFRLRDELYRYEALPGGLPLRTLATGRGDASGEDHPVVLASEGEAGRVVVITLGHDGAAHEHPAFGRLVRNAVAWLAPRAER